MRNSLVMVVLALVAVATWLYGRPPREADEQAAVTGRGEPLGYYLRGARLLGTDENGRIAYRILADRLEERPDEALLELSGVRVDYEPAGEASWLIWAATARAPKDGSELDLEGGVELRSQPVDGGEPVSIAAERLRFLPDTSMAETDVPVRIRVGDWQLDAVGLRTHLKGDTLRLESSVHGTFSR